MMDKVVFDKLHQSIHIQLYSGNGALEQLDLHKQVLILYKLSRHNPSLVPSVAPHFFHILVVQ